MPANKRIKGLQSGITQRNYSSELNVQGISANKITELSTELTKVLALHPAL